MKNSKRPYTMTRRAETAAATRQRILDSAVQLYCDRQIEEFTLDEVARRAGATVQTALRDFGSKENLLLAALHRLAEGGASLKPTPPGDVAAAVGAIFDLYESMGDLLMQRLADERRHPGDQADARPRPRQSSPVGRRTYSRRWSSAGAPPSAPKSSTR